ncbi:MAG: M28 family peptidase [Phycisphaeraceae bacterium]|nr:M28 family peptidase [Phycisphaerae bacterium]MBX3393248.1 M28 family peptidase [Phycisphaeraceae bacterium]HRJ49216.1 M28 family peptidase [Phycisphaerales bacterium]
MPRSITDVIDRVNNGLLSGWHDLLGSEPHVAGTPGDERVIERIERAFEQMGLEVRRHEFWALLPRPLSAVLQILSPEPRDLILQESPLDDDRFTRHPALDPGWNAFSGSGEATGPVVYANYGRREDFERLASLGVSVRGRIVIARYGGNYRGFKAKFAQEAGAAGLVIYTDPADGGYTRGLVYPEGGYANETCIERGSLLTLPYVGDALTPFVEATREAPRLDVSAVGLCTIPVQPIGYGAALEIMKRMSGSAVAEHATTRSWQGGLPVPYRFTGGETLRVRIKVEQDREVRRSANVIGLLKGAVEPDRMVVVGCHHDAWGFGASDPLAGTITLMEAARVIAEASAGGRAPRRTIAFCAWGAEEFGIIGSTEWVEGHRDMLSSEAVAYLNLDMAAMGVEFGASSGPSIRRVIARTAADVRQARDPSRSVLEAWMARSKDAGDPGMPAFGDLGGGSDHVAFWCHVGVASAGLGAGGSLGTSYHSIYDTLEWYRRVVGNDYEPAAMITRMAAGTALRLADEPVAPIEPHAAVASFRRHLRDISARGASAGLWEAPSVATSGSPDPLGPVAEPLAGIDDDARETESVVRRAVLPWLGSEAALGEPERIDRTGRLLATDRAWVAPGGLPDRPWFRNTFAAPDRDSGYAAWMLPLLRAAVENKDAEEARSALAVYGGVMRSLREVVEVPGE